MTGSGSQLMLDAEVRPVNRPITCRARPYGACPGQAIGRGRGRRTGAVDDLGLEQWRVPQAKAAVTSSEPVGPRAETGPSAGFLIRGRARDTGPDRPGFATPGFQKVTEAGDFPFPGSGAAAYSESSRPEPPGRPSISDEVIALDLRLAGENRRGVSCGSTVSRVGSDTGSRLPPSAGSRSSSNSTPLACIPRSRTVRLCRSAS